MIPTLHLPKPTGELIFASQIKITDEHGNPEPFRNTQDMELVFDGNKKFFFGLWDMIDPATQEFLRTNKPMVIKLTHCYVCPKQPQPQSDGVIDALRRWDKNGSMEIKP